MICLLFPFLAVWKGLYRRPIYHLPLAPVMARDPSSERALRGGPSYQLLLCFICPLIIACGSSGPAQLSFARPERASLPFAFLLYLPQLWRAARPRSERSVGCPVIICCLFHLPTFMARGPSGPAYRCLSAQFAPIMARCPSGPAYHCLAALYRARLERASSSFAPPERASLSFALMPDLRRSPLRVKSAPRAGGRLIILSRMVTHAVAFMPKTAKCACVANKLN